MFLGIYIDAVKLSATVRKEIMNMVSGRWLT